MLFSFSFEKRIVVSTTTSLPFKAATGLIETCLCEMEVNEISCDISNYQP